METNQTSALPKLNVDESCDCQQQVLPLPPVPRTVPDGESWQFSCGIAMVMGWKMDKVSKLWSAPEGHAITEPVPLFPLYATDPLLISELVDELSRRKVILRLSMINGLWQASVYDACFECDDKGIWSDMPNTNCTLSRVLCNAIWWSASYTESYFYSGAWAKDAF